MKRSRTWSPCWTTPSGWWPGSASRTSEYVRAHARADLAVHGDERRATTRIFGSKPGACGAGLLPLIDARNWRDNADLAEVYAAWGGFAYGRDLDGREARADMETSYRRIAVAAHNTDTLEHDIADSDDYFQYHGGMIATVRALTGHAATRLHRRLNPPGHRPHPVARRGDRARVPRPRGQPALGGGDEAARLQGRVRARRHGGLPVRLRRHRQASSRTGCTSRLTQAYVLDESMREFFAQSNPWALTGIAERLLEAADRQLWDAPDPEILAALRQAYLETEGDLEAGDHRSPRGAGGKRKIRGQLRLTVVGSALVTE